MGLLRELVGVLWTEGRERAAELDFYRADGRNDKGKSRVRIWERMRTRTFAFCALIGPAVATESDVTRHMNIPRLFQVFSEPSLESSLTTVLVRSRAKNCQGLLQPRIMQ